jgi:hypothetical protein
MLAPLQMTMERMEKIGGGRIKSYLFQRNFCASWPQIAPQLHCRKSPLQWNTSNTAQREVCFAPSEAGEAVLNALAWEMREKRWERDGKEMAKRWERDGIEMVKRW